MARKKLLARYKIRYKVYANELITDNEFTKKINKRFTKRSVRKKFKNSEPFSEIYSIRRYKF